MTLRVAEPDLHAAVRRVMKDHHPGLAEAGVTVTVLIHSGKSPLRHRAWPAEATIRISSPRERAQGIADAVLTMDAKVMMELDDHGLIALIDHELHHLMVAGWVGARDDKGRVIKNQRTPKLDDNDRPKLRIRQHDYELGGFFEMAERHGAAAREVVSMATLRADERGQVFWAEAFGEATSIKTASNGAASDVAGKAVKKLVDDIKKRGRGLRAVAHEDGISFHKI